MRAAILIATAMVLGCAPDAPSPDSIDAMAAAIQQHAAVLIEETASDDPDELKIITAASAISSLANSIRSEVER